MNYGVTGLRKNANHQRGCALQVPTHRKTLENTRRGYHSSGGVSAGDVSVKARVRVRVRCRLGVTDTLSLTFWHARGGLELPVPGLGCDFQDTSPHPQGRP